MARQRKGRQYASLSVSLVRVLKCPLRPPDKSRIGLALLPVFTVHPLGLSQVGLVMQMRFVVSQCAKDLPPLTVPSFLKYFPHLASESHYSAGFSPVSLAASSKSSLMAPTFLLNLYNLKLPKAKSLGHLSSPPHLIPDDPIHHDFKY